MKGETRRVGLIGAEGCVEIGMGTVSETRAEGAVDASILKNEAVGRA
jgi:hypothetical protein